MSSLYNTSFQMVRVIHALRQIVNTNVKWSTTKLSAYALMDTSLTPMEDRVLTEMNAFITMETAITYATTMLVLTLVLAVQATI